MAISRLNKIMLMNWKVVALFGGGWLVYNFLKSQPDVDQEDYPVKGYDASCSDQVNMRMVGRHYLILD